MSSKPQIAKLIEAFSTNSKKTIAAAMETAKRMPIADMKKVVEGVKKTNPRAATKLQNAIDSGKGSALSRIVEAYNIKPKAKAGATKSTPKKASLKQDDVLPEPPKGLATSKSQATDTTDLSSKPTRPEPIAKSKGRPKGEPDIPPEQGMQPAVSDTVSSDAPAAPLEDDGAVVPYERKNARTVQAAPEGQMATSTPENEMFAAVNETMMSPSLAPNRSVSLAEQQPSALSDLLNSGEFGTIPEAGLDARGRTPLTPVTGDARTAGMLTEGEAAYPQAGVLDTASGQNVPQRSDPNFIRSSSPGTELSVIPQNTTPPPVEQQFKAENIFPGQEQGFTVPDTSEGMIRRLTGPVDNTPPPVDPSLASDSIAPDAIRGAGVPVAEGNGLIVRDALPQSAYPQVSSDVLGSTTNTQMNNAGGRFTFGRTPEVEQAGELIPTKPSMGDQMASNNYTPPKNSNATETVTNNDAAKGIRGFIKKHPVISTIGGSIAAPIVVATGNALIDSTLDSFDEMNADTERRNSHLRTMEVLKKQVTEGDNISLFQSNEQMNRMFNGDLPEPAVEQRPSKIKNKKPNNLEDTI